MASDSAENATFLGSSSSYASSCLRSSYLSHSLIGLAASKLKLPTEGEFLINDFSSNLKI